MKFITNNNIELYGWNPFLIVKYEIFHWETVIFNKHNYIERREISFVKEQNENQIGIGAFIMNNKCNLTLILNHFIIKIA